jgi:riboflavin kinase/FMN adenylyltransferase
VWITSSLDTIKTPTFVALGNFDGVHRGHQQVIQPILGNSYATVVTFNPHPQEFFTGQRRSLLTPLDEKAAYLESLGVEQLVLLPFDQALASLTPQEFVAEILVQRLQSQRVSVGQDFCFGRQRSGTTAVLQAIAAQFGVTVQITPLHTDAGERISSSAIRHALQSGDLHYANRLLGRPYTLSGQVVQGQQLGRTIGFPTANLKLPPEKFLPRQGVYSVWVQRLSASHLAQSPGPSLAGMLPGVMNLGTRPTVDGTVQAIEVHLLDWSGNLYGEKLMVSLADFLRPEQKFASLDDLKAQIQADCDQARSQLHTSPELDKQGIDKSQPCQSS